MKKLVLVAIVVLTVGALTNQQKIQQLLSWSPCDAPTAYRIGQLDPRFKISTKTFQDDLDEAGGIWNNAYGKALFVYDPMTKLTINLVYDERQSLSTQVQNLEVQLKNEKGPITTQLSQYESLAADFKKHLDDLNSQIEYWNSRGGAPQDIYNQLTSQQNDLKNMADKLNSMAQALNLSAQKYNLNVSTFNQALNTFQEVLQAKPEEGLYKGSDGVIEIYLTQSQNELIHTLAHELGHSLGLTHNQDKNSIMYAMTSENLKPTEEDLAGLQQVCQERNVFDLLTTKFSLKSSQK